MKFASGSMIQPTMIPMSTFVYNNYYAFSYRDDNDTVGTTTFSIGTDNKLTVAKFAGMAAIYFMGIR